MKLLALLAWDGVSAKSWIQQKLLYELKKKRKKKKKKEEKVTKKKNIPTKNHYAPTMEPLSSLWESTNLLHVGGILFKIE